MILQSTDGSEPDRELSEEESAAIEKQWEENFFPDCTPRYMVQVWERNMTPEQLAACIAQAEGVPKPPAEPQ